VGEMRKRKEGACWQKVKGNKERRDSRSKIGDYLI